MKIETVRPTKTQHASNKVGTMIEFSLAAVSRIRVLIRPGCKDGEKG